MWRDQLAAVLESQQAAWNRGDLAAFMDAYARSDALVFTSGGEIHRGWQETYDRYLARYGADRSTMGTLALDLLDVRAAGQGAAIVLGRFTLTTGTITRRGTFTLVLERQPDHCWKILHDHTSLDA